MPVTAGLNASFVATEPDAAIDIVGPVQPTDLAVVLASTDPASKGGWRATGTSIPHTTPHSSDQPYSILGYYRFQFHAKL